MRLLVLVPLAVRAAVALDRCARVCDLTAFDFKRKGVRDMLARPALALARAQVFFGFALWRNDVDGARLSIGLAYTSCYAAVRAFFAAFAFKLALFRVEICPSTAAVWLAHAILDERC